MALLVSGLLMAAAFPTASPPGFAVDLSAWGISGPESLRFGILTQSQSSFQSQGTVYLSRLSNSAPQHSQAPQAIHPALKNESVIPTANAQGSVALGPHSLTVAHAMGAFQKLPTHAAIALSQDQLKLTVDQKGTGYGGGWINLSALATGQTGFLDLRGYKYLSFWVQSQGQFRLKLADRQGFKKEDAQDLGILAHFYQPRLSNHSHWRQVVIALDETLQPQGLDRSAIANLVLQADPQDHSIHSLTLRALTLHSQLPPQAPPFSVTPPPATGLPPAQPYHTWIWNTDELLGNPDTWQPLLSQLNQLWVGEVYLQWPDTKKNTKTSETLADLVKAFHTAHIKVHALDGAPYFAETQHHPEVFDTLDALAQFQNSQPKTSQFDGIHYDIEPYLLPGFFGARQEEISQSYVTLVKAIHQRAQALHIPFGLSLPFWLDMPDEFTGEALLVKQEGLTAPLYEHLQNHSDYVAIMDYKTHLLGPGGIIESAQNELNFARQHHKKVVIGLETMDLPDEHLFIFEGSPRRQQPPASEASMVFYQASGTTASRQWRVHLMEPGAVLPAEIRQSEQQWFWSLSPYAQVRSEQLSFAKKGPEALTDILRGAENTLGQDPAFGGIALHHSESLFSLMAKATDSFHFTSKGDPCGLTSVSAFNQPTKVISR